MARNGVGDARLESGVPRSFLDSAGPGQVLATPVATRVSAIKRPFDFQCRDSTEEFVDNLVIIRSPSAGTLSAKNTCSCPEVRLDSLPNRLAGMLSPCAGVTISSRTDAIARCPSTVFIQVRGSARQVNFTRQILGHADAGLEPVRAKRQGAGRKGQYDSWSSHSTFDVPSEMTWFPIRRVR